MNMQRRAATGTSLFAAAIFSCAMPAGAQQPAFSRTILQSQDLGSTGRVAVVARVEFQPGAVIDRHTHPGEEIGYVLEGTLVLEVEGKPPVTLQAGDAYVIEAGHPHGGKNGAMPARVVAAYVVEKGKPLATPVK